MITVVGIYIFIVLGFFAKKTFNEIDGKTLVLLSTYFLQPFLTLWGIMLIPLDYNLIISPVAYLAAVFFSLVFTFTLSLILKDKKERIIAALTPLIGNTGNLGIPLSYALFGDIGASIATIVNLANIFFIYSFGVFFFASGKYSFKDAFKKIVKIPVMWFGILALVLNISGVTFSKDIMKILQMGAFASIVVQLLIFGIYVAEIKTREISFKLGIITVFNKFIIFPAVSFFVLKLFHLNTLFFKAVMLEILTPLAVTNVNLSALFDLYPRKVAMLVIVTSVLFLGVVFLII
ncbi:transporter [Nautilia sp. PV-1]|uniref:AEC family transporter n=1 Tax=Nautilia sp. PV-1 TaxID=2579250 RepID=UPI000FDA2429|nr:AEC family transporter [Nautilia sp. PV-1]AZV47013.1 transporter [Nautilia sp. PV-1]